MITQIYKKFTASELTKQATCIKLLNGMRVTYDLLASNRLDKKPNIRYYS